MLSIKRSKQTKGTIPSDFLVDFDESILAVNTDTPETILERYNNFEELIAKVRDCLSKLEFNVLLKLFGGLSYKEISCELNISTKTVDNAVQRIRKKFSKLN